MNSKVKVEANKQGDLISKSPNNPQWGWIRVTQTRGVMSDEGILTTQFFSALVIGAVKDLNKLGWEDGQELEGKIIFKESMEPFNTRNPERDLKVAGKSGIVCSVGSDPVYRKYFYSPNAKAEDVSIPHDDACKQAIRESHLAMEAENELQEENDENFTL